MTSRNHASETAHEIAGYAEGGLFRLLQAVTAMLIAARWLIPPEAAVFGDSLWIVQFWIAAVLLWGWDAYRRCDFRVRFDVLDLAVGILVLGHVLSTIKVLLGYGDQRAALNLMWEWVALGVSFFLLRQVLRTRHDCRRLWGVMLAAAVMLSGLGIWQHYVELPNLVERYEELARDLEQQAADPGSFSRAERIRLQRERVELGVPDDPVTRELWEDRLKSTEPFATFALANTLAGFLAAWLLVGFDAGRNSLLMKRDGVAFSWKDAGGWFGLLLVSYCLVLTKSRTAWVGFLAGFLLWIGIRWGGGSRKLWRRGLIGVGGIAVLGVILFAAAALSGGFDRQVLSEAPKSLTYRLQYWTASWKVVQKQPWLGTGPGNFRPHYLHDKLPGSSEEIADPHNWILDLWTSGGLLALAGFLFLIFLVVRRGPRSGENNSATQEDNASEIQRVTVWELGAAAGFPLVMFVRWMAGEPAGIRHFWLLAGWILACGIWGTIRREDRPSAGFLAGGLALLVHLLGAGGIEMPAIVQTLLILAVLLSWRDWQTATWKPHPKTVLAITAAAVLGFVLCLKTATRPSWYRSVNIASGDAALAADRNIPAARQFYEQARKADPYSPEPAVRLAELAFQRWQITGNERDFDRAVKYGKTAIDLDPASNQSYRRLGLWYYRKAEETESSQAADDAVKYLSEAVVRYPNSSRLRAEYALALELAGQGNAAGKQASRALALDRMNRQAGHRDKYLPVAIVKKLERLAP